MTDPLAPQAARRCRRPRRAPPAPRRCGRRCRSSTSSGARPTSPSRSSSRPCRRCSAWACGSSAPRRCWARSSPCARARGRWPSPGQPGRRPCWSARCCSAAGSAWSPSPSSGCRPGVAALLVAAMPLWVVLLRAGSGDRPSRSTWPGCSPASRASRSWSLPGSGDGGPGAGHGRILLGTASWALGSFLQPRLPLPADPFALTFYEMLPGGLVLCAIGLLRGEAAEVDPADFSAALAVGVGLPRRGRLAVRLHRVRLAARARAAVARLDLRLRQPGGRRAAGLVVLGEPLTPACSSAARSSVAGVMLVVRGERPDAPI